VLPGTRLLWAESQHLIVYKKSLIVGAMLAGRPGRMGRKDLLAGPLSGQDDLFDTL